jgi:uncharacterized protein YacL
MLTDKEEQFLQYWSKNRIDQQKSFWQFAKGLSTGLVIGIGIVLTITIGWYERADMEANSKLSPVLFIIIIIIIAVFMAYFYRNYQWEMKEQQYLELLAKKKKMEKIKPEKVSTEDTQKNG